MKLIRGRVPPHVVEIHGSARAFKALKRKQLLAARKAINALHTGCAFFPCGNGPMIAIDRALDEVEKSITAKVWGR